MKPMRYTLLASTLALVLMGAGCASSTTTDTTTTTNTNAVVTNTNTAASNTNSTVTVDVTDDTINTVETDTTDSDVVVNETKTFDVVANQFAFSPSTITVNAGDTVVINLTSSDVPHGFSLPDFGVSATITPGSTKTVEFVADAAGSYSFSCSVVCGAGHSGMRGTLVVN